MQALFAVLTAGASGLLLWLTLRASGLERKLLLITFTVTCFLTMILAEAPWLGLAVFAYMIVVVTALSINIIVKDMWENSTSLFLYGAWPGTYKGFMQLRWVYAYGNGIHESVKPPQKYLVPHT